MRQLLKLRSKTSLAADKQIVSCNIDSTSMMNDDNEETLTYEPVSYIAQEPIPVTIEISPETSPHTNRRQRQKSATKSGSSETEISQKRRRHKRKKILRSTSNLEEASMKADANGDTSMNQSNMTRRGSGLQRSKSNAESYYSNENKTENRKRTVLENSLSLDFSADDVEYHNNRFSRNMPSRKTSSSYGSFTSHSEMSAASSISSISEFNDTRRSYESLPDEIDNRYNNYNNNEIKGTVNPKYLKGRSSRGEKTGRYPLVRSKSSVSAYYAEQNEMNNHHHNQDDDNDYHHYVDDNNNSNYLIVENHGLVKSTSYDNKFIYDENSAPVTDGQEKQHQQRIRRKESEKKKSPHYLKGELLRPNSLQDSIERLSSSMKELNVISCIKIETVL